MILVCKLRHEEVALLAGSGRVLLWGPRRAALGGWQVGLCCKFQALASVKGWVCTVIVPRPHVL